MFDGEGMVDFVVGAVVHLLVGGQLALEFSHVAFFLGTHVGAGAFCDRGGGQGLLLVLLQAHQTIACVEYL